jgi:hypothetical protein
MADDASMTNSHSENLCQVVMISEPSIRSSLLFEHDLSENRRSAVRMRSGAFRRSCANCGDHVIRNSSRRFASDNAVQVLYKSKLAALQNLNKTDERKTNVFTLRDRQTIMAVL